MASAEASGVGGGGSAGARGVNHRAATIVGAGVGGLTAAALLAREGWRVRVIERRPTAGGKACVREESGYLYDEGPSILVLKKVYEDLFERLGVPMEEHLRFTELDPAFLVRGPEGRGFHIHRAFGDTLASVARYCPAAAEELRAFVEGLDAFARVLGLAYADRALSSWADFLHPRLVASGLFVSPFEKYLRYVDSRICDPLLREFLHGFPGYAGYHPAEAPASLVLLPWSIFREGVLYPEGGVSAIPAALEAVARRFGAEFEFGTTVEGLERAGDRVAGLRTSRGGVTLAEGEQVVFGGCLGWLATVGAPAAFAPAKREAYAAQSPSFFTLQTGISVAQREAFGLAHHTLFLPGMPGVSYQDYFEPGLEPPPTPPLYVNIPSITDRSVAPPGRDNVFVVVSVPSHRAGTNLAVVSSNGERYARRLAQELGRYLPGIDFSGAPFHVKGTARFEAELLQRGGQIYGPSLRTSQILAGFARPHPRVAGHSNLWLVGGGTQPGAGLPMVVQSGKVVARELAAAVG